MDNAALKQEISGYDMPRKEFFTYADGNPNDYDTRRNTRYIYTVTLRGINDIRLEVESDGELPARNLISRVLLLMMVS